MENKKNVTKTIINYIGDILYFIIVMPIIIISIIVIYKSIMYPTKIPDVFGIKPFIILDGEMDETIDEGDLVFTKIINTDDLKIGDLIAFRNSKNLVTMHRISSIDDKYDSKTFMMKTSENETNDAKTVDEEAVEGIFIKRIPNVGNWLMFIQSVRGLLIIVGIILFFGVIAYIIAARLDKIEIEKEEETQEQIEENHQEAVQEEEQQEDDSRKFHVVKK